MNRSYRSRAVGVVAAMAVFVPAAIAWACVGLMSLTTSSSSVQPGGTVTVFGKEFAQGAPIEIHLDSPTGPVLATVPAPTDTMTSQWDVVVTIPASTPTGQHFLVATQAYHYMNTGAPARAAISVGVPAPAPAAPAARPAKVSIESGPSAISLVLISLAVAAVGLAVAGAWTAASARRPPQSEAVKAT